MVGSRVSLVSTSLEARSLLRSCQLTLDQLLFIYHQSRNKRQWEWNQSLSELPWNFSAKITATDHSSHAVLLDLSSSVWARICHVLHGNNKLCIKSTRVIIPEGRSYCSVLKHAQWHDLIRDNACMRSADKKNYQAHNKIMLQYVRLPGPCQPGPVKHWQPVLPPAPWQLGPAPSPLQPLWGTALGIMDMTGVVWAAPCAP